MEGITRFLEEELGLQVNKEKSEVTLIKNVTFLGFQILRGKIRVSDKGWVGNLRIQEFKYLFRNLDAWIRSRIRSIKSI